MAERLFHDFQIDCCGQVNADQISERESESAGKLFFSVIAL